MEDQEHVEILKKGVDTWNKWREENPGIRPNLYGVDLSRADLSMADLIVVNLRRAKLSEADLIEVKLSGADLTGADLSRADLSRARLNGADLTGADLSKANLSGAKLRGAVLSGADLRDVGFSKANLSGADLSWADLREVGFKGVDLREARLFEADLTGADLTEADLSGADLSGANLGMADISRSMLDESILLDADMSRAILVKANLSNADISGANLDDANISRWTIKGIKCTNILRNGKPIDYAEGEFEKRYTQIENIIEVIWIAPFSDLTHFTGKFIELMINAKYGDAVLLFKGQEALSDNTTQQKFIGFAEQKKLYEIQRQIKVVEQKLNPVLKEISDKKKPKSTIDIKEEIDLGKALVVRPKEIARVLNDNFMTISPVLQQVFLTIQETFK